MNKIVTTDPISEAQIQAWKDEFINVFSIEYPETNEENSPVITGYFRRPKLQEIGVAAMNSDGNSFKSAIILYDTAFIGGHPAFESDDEVKTSAIKEFKTITETRKATVKKL